MQTIYYNFHRKYLCDASGAAVSELPEITFAEKPTWRIVPINDTGTVVIPSGIVGYRAAVKFDFNSASEIAIRTLNQQISADESGIEIQLNANTVPFLTAVDGKESSYAYFELSGLDSGGDRVFYLAFRCIARMILDPDLDQQLPEDVESAFLDRATAEILLANKADDSDLTALTSRVAANETAIESKASSSSLSSLADRVTAAESSLVQKADAADAVPPGTVLAFSGPAANLPTGYLLCNGAAVSRTDYAELFTAVGTTYGAGDASTTFNLPDFRGKFLRGYLDGTSAALGTAQGDAARRLFGAAHKLVGPYAEADYDTTVGVINLKHVQYGHFYNANDENRGLLDLTFDTNYLASGGTYPTASENRPVNYAVNWIIKY